MADRLSQFFTMGDQTCKENIDTNSILNSHFRGVRQSENTQDDFDNMKKTSCNHKQLANFLSISHHEESLKKPAYKPSVDYSQIFQKYANIGSNEASRPLTSATNMENMHSSTMNNEYKFGTASILTNSSISGTQSIDLPLQNALNSSSSIAASKAILALQEKLKVVDRENSFLREIVATSEQKNKKLEEVKKKLEESTLLHQKEIQASYNRETELQNQVSMLQQEHTKMLAYTEASLMRIKELEDSQSRSNSTLESYPNSDIAINTEKYSELVDKIAHYEQVIDELENQRSESLEEISQMKNHIEMFSESMRASKSSQSNPKPQYSSPDSKDKYKKLLKENRKLKDQMFKQKKDSEAKLLNIKKRNKMEIDGYKQE